MRGKEEEKGGKKLTLATVCSIWEVGRADAETLSLLHGGIVGGFPLLVGGGGIVAGAFRGHGWSGA